MTANTAPIASKLTLVQNLLTGFSRESKINEMDIDDIAGVIVALSQWLVACAETPRNVSFFLRGDNLGRLFTQLCLNTDTKVEVETLIGIELNTSSISVTGNERTYAHGLYLRMIKEIKGMFGMSTSPYFDFGENQRVPFIIHTK